jgi:hypothetical protein
VAAHGNVPAVIECRRVALIDQGLPTMPYEHDTTAMREDEANAVIARVRRSIAARTSEALRRVVIELAPAHTADLLSTHLLTGLSECGACHGGFMVRHDGPTARGRRASYVCTAFK